MKALFILTTLILIFGIKLQSAHAFEYVMNHQGAFTNSQFNTQNLLENGWFVNRSTCKYSDTGWTTNTALDDNNNVVKLWDQSAKYQDPIDTSCDDADWTGFATRFADKSGTITPFFPGIEAKIWQAVDAGSANHSTLHFHALIVAHRVNDFKASIYGSNTSKDGPWTQDPLWVPFHIQNCLSPADCVNDTYGAASNNGDRTGLWKDIALDIYSLPGSVNIIDPGADGPLNPVRFNPPQTYRFYKIEFMMKYPQPDSTATGNVGGKLARVFFKVSGSGGTTSTPIPLLGDIEPSGGDGDVDFADYQTFIPFFRKTSSTADFNNNGRVDIFDFNILVTNI